MKSVGFPKIKIGGKGSFRPPIPQALDRDSEIGDYVSYNTMSNTYEGILREWDSNVAIIELADGTTKTAEC